MSLWWDHRCDNTEVPPERSPCPDAFRPHCCGEQQYSIKVLIHPDCKNCGKNMTRSINKKFSRCKGIARCLALLPIGIGLFVQSTFWNILGLIISLLLFALVELIFMKTAHEFKS